MSEILFDKSLSIGEFGWGLNRNDVNFESQFGSQGLEISPPLWEVQIETAGGMTEENSGDWKVLILQLKGRINQLLLWNVNRPSPLGTMRGNMTLNQAASQGDTVMSIVASGEVGKTLLKGDLLGIGTGLTRQVVMCTGNPVSDGSGIIDFPFEPPIRNDHLLSAVVTWDKPMALFRRADSVDLWKRKKRVVAVNSYSFREDVRP